MNDLHYTVLATSPSAPIPAATMLCDTVSDCFLVQLVSASILDLILIS